MSLQAARIPSVSHRPVHSASHRPRAAAPWTIRSLRGTHVTAAAAPEASDAPAVAASAVFAAGSVGAVKSAAGPAAAASETAVASLWRALEEDAQPELWGAIKGEPAFTSLVGLQADALGRLAAGLGVRPTQTKHTDAQGVLKLQSLKPGLSYNLFRSYRMPPGEAGPMSAATAAAAAAGTGTGTGTGAGAPRIPPVRCMTLAFGCFRTPAGTARLYTKTTVSAPDDWPTPQLDVEIGGTADGDLIFYVGLAPKASLITDKAYLDRYYNRPPPPLTREAAASLLPLPPPAETPAAVTAADKLAEQFRAEGSAPDGTTTGGAATTGGADGSPEAMRSFQAIEAEARRQPGFVPFVSPSLMVRSLAAGALCFSVQWQGASDPRVMALMRRYVAEITNLWLAHLSADVASMSGGGDGGSADPWVVEQWRRSGEFLRAVQRNDPLTPMLYPVFGEAQVNKWFETLEGLELPAA